MTLPQRWPGDFEATVARAPIGNFFDFFIQFTASTSLASAVRRA